MLRAVKMDGKIIKEAVERCNTSLLSSDILTELLKFVPTDEEVIIIILVDSFKTK